MCPYAQHTYLISTELRTRIFEGVEYVVAINWQEQLLGEH
jgi:hypothetical protein